ncbi:MAG: hypothetical protein AAB253_07575, partial [candidate division NC10 bacterium]
HGGYFGEALLDHLERGAGAATKILIGTYRGNAAAQAHLRKHGFRPVADSDAVLRAYYQIPEAQRRGSIAFEKKAPGNTGTRGYPQITQITQIFPE